MTQSSDIQRAFAAHIRHPQVHEAPQGIEDRRLQVYRDLIYNNIEGFIASGFPVLRGLYADDDWHRMIRDFVHRHQSISPYFVDVSKEFIGYISDERQSQPCDPPFLLELATYEWAELALFVAEGELPQNDNAADPNLLDAIPYVSPLAWSMIFRYPVHHIGSDFQPAEPSAEPVCLVVYRNRKEQVKFLESNPVTARLLELCEANEGQTARQLLLQIAAEMGVEGGSDSSLIEGGEAVLAKLRNLDIIFFKTQSS